jgi:hypothetical protein
MVQFTEQDVTKYQFSISVLCDIVSLTGFDKFIILWI